MPFSNKLIITKAKLLYLTDLTKDFNFEFRYRKLLLQTYLLL